MNLIFFRPSAFGILIYWAIWTVVDICAHALARLPLYLPWRVTDGIDEFISLKHRQCDYLKTVNGVRGLIRELIGLWNVFCINFIRMNRIFIFHLWNISGLLPDRGRLSDICPLVAFTWISFSFILVWISAFCSLWTWIQTCLRE